MFSRLRHDGSIRSNSESTRYYWGCGSWTFHLQHLTQLHPLQRCTADPEHRVRTQNTHMHILLNGSVTPFIQHSHPVSLSQLHSSGWLLSRTHHQHGLQALAGFTQGALRPLAAHRQWLPAQDGGGAGPWVPGCLSRYIQGLLNCKSQVH